MYLVTQTTFSVLIVKSIFLLIGISGKCLCSVVRLEQNNFLKKMLWGIPIFPSAQNQWKTGTTTPADSLNTFCRHTPSN